MDVPWSEEAMHRHSLKIAEGIKRTAMARSRRAADIQDCAMQARAERVVTLAARVCVRHRRAIRVTGKTLTG